MGIRQTWGSAGEWVKGRLAYSVSGRSDDLPSQARFESTPGFWIKRLKTSNTFLPVVGAVIAILMVIFIYGHVVFYGFVDYDDPFYIFDNDEVSNGLSLSGLCAAFSRMDGFYQPLTWISFMSEVEVFGLNPGIMHVTNVLLHIATSALLYIFLTKLTESRVTAAYVSIVHAVHPINVESVAWISERKGLLAGMLGVLSLLLYTEWIASSRRRTYFASFGVFLASLLAKPSFALIWVLVLIVNSIFSRARIFRSKSLLSVLPFFTIGLCSIYVTYHAERHVGAIPIKFDARLAIKRVITFYGFVVEKGLWPYDLRTPCVEGEYYSLTGISLALLLLAGAAYVCCRNGKQRVVGFATAWLLVVTLPVCGIFHVGGHALADRYAYLAVPGLGLLTGTAISLLMRRSPALAVGGSAIYIICLMMHSTLQVQTWQNSDRLFSNALHFEPANYLARYHHGLTLLKQGRTDSARQSFAELLRQRPGFEPAAISYTSTLVIQTNIAGFEILRQLNPSLYSRNSAIMFNRGITFLEAGDGAQAQHLLGAAIRLNPCDTRSLYMYGQILKSQRRYRAALYFFERGFESDPEKRIGCLESLDLASRLGDSKRVLKYLTFAREQTHRPFAIYE